LVAKLIKQWDAVGIGSAVFAISFTTVILEFSHGAIMACKICTSPLTQTTRDAVGIIVVRKLALCAHSAAVVPRLTDFCDLSKRALFALTCGIPVFAPHALGAVRGTFFFRRLSCLTCFARGLCWALLVLSN
jgi:hypothetical protein